jgi:hypothetical protein
MARKIERPKSAIGMGRVRFAGGQLKSIYEVDKGINEKGGKKMKKLDSNCKETNQKVSLKGLITLMYRY